MENESHTADADIFRPGSFDSIGSAGGFEPSSSLRARIEKLAQWRIHPSSITFPGQARELCGGHATVLEARMDIRGMGRRRVGRRRGIDVAVKKIRIADDTNLERALGLAIREAEFLEELSHPNVTRFEGLIEDLSNNVIWLVFPWAHNGNLKDFVALREWELPEKIWLIGNVARGLAYLHGREPPICHGDLKSLNVLVDRRGSAAITDFGSARRLPQSDRNPRVDELESQSQSAQPLNATFCASTNTITLTGNKYTLRWAAPELLIEDQLGLWSDIWALGWIAYEVMTNSLPFYDASTDIVVVERVLGGKLPSLTDNAHLSLIHELCSLMTMCWKRDPTERPTADRCRRFVEMMPMLVPELHDALIPGTTSDRLLKVERLRELGHIYQSRGEYLRAFDFFVKAIERSRMRKDVERIFLCLIDLAQLHRAQNKYDEAIQLYSEALEIRTELSISEVRASALLDLAGVHRLRGEYGEVIPLYSEVLELRTALDDRKGRADVLWDLAQVHVLRRQYHAAIPLYSKALELRTDLADKKGRADLLWDLAQVHLLQDQYDAAIPLCSEALELLTEIGDRKGRADVLLDLAQVHLLRGEFDVAIRLYTEVLEILTDFGDRKDLPDTLWNLIEGHRLGIPFKKAIPLFSEVVEIRTHLGDSGGKADALLDLADVHRLHGEYAEAIPLYSEALNLCTDLGDKKGRADILCNLAQVHLLCGQYNKAVPLYSEVLDIRTNLGDIEGKANALRGLADVHRLRMEYDQAALLYSAALEICTSLGDRKGRGGALWGLAEGHRLRSEYEKATLLYSKVLEICTDLGDRKSRAGALWGLAEGHRLRSQYKKATPLYSKVLDICTDIGDRQGRADALRGLAHVYRLQSQSDNAFPLYTEALTLYTDLGDREGRADVRFSLLFSFYEPDLRMRESVAFAELLLHFVIMYHRNTALITRVFTRLSRVFDVLLPAQMRMPGDQKRLGAALANILKATQYNGRFNDADYKSAVNATFAIISHPRFACSARGPNDRQCTPKTQKELWEFICIGYWKLERSSFDGGILSSEMLTLTLRAFMTACYIAGCPLRMMKFSEEVFRADFMPLVARGLLAWQFLGDRALSAGDIQQTPAVCMNLHDHLLRVGRAFRSNSEDFLGDILSQGGLAEFLDVLEFAKLINTNRPTNAPIKLWKAFCQLGNLDIRVDEWEGRERAKRADKPEGCTWKKCPMYGTRGSERRQLLVCRQCKVAGYCGEFCQMK